MPETCHNSSHTHTHYRTQYNIDKAVDTLMHKLNRVMKQLHMWSQNNNL